MSYINEVATQISKSLESRVAAVDRDVEWQRVNSLIADVLKDAHVLYAKLARLQGDFAGKELDDLEKISEGVLGIGGKLSTFSKAFYEGKAVMMQSDLYGSDSGPMFGGSTAPVEPSPSSEPASSPSEPAVEAEFSIETSPDLDETSEASNVEVDFDYSPEESEEASSSAEASEKSE